MCKLVLSPDPMRVWGMRLCVNNIQVSKFALFHSFSCKYGLPQLPVSLITLHYHLISLIEVKWPGRLSKGGLGGPISNYWRYDRQTWETSSCKLMFGSKYVWISLKYIPQVQATMQRWMCFLWNAFYATSFPRNLTASYKTAEFSLLSVSCAAVWRGPNKAALRQYTLTSCFISFQLPGSPDSTHFLKPANCTLDILEQEVHSAAVSTKFGANGFVLCWSITAV